MPLSAIDFGSDTEFLVPKWKFLVDPYRIVKSTMLSTSPPEIEGAESADLVRFSAQPCWRPPEHLMTGKAAEIFHENLNIEVLTTS